MRWVHREPLSALIGASRRVSRDGFLKGLAAVLITSLLSEILLYCLQPDIARGAISLSSWLLFLIPIVALTLLQTSSEEVLFRGYLLRGLAKPVRSPYVWALLPGLLFTSMHWSSTSSAAINACVLASIAAFALLLTLLVYVDRQSRRRLRRPSRQQPDRVPADFASGKLQFLCPVQRQAARRRRLDDARCRPHRRDRHRLQPADDRAAAASALAAEGRAGCLSSPRFRLMRITLVAPGVLPARGYGGTERQVDWLATELVRAGHHVVLIAGAGSSHPLCQVRGVSTEAQCRAAIPADTEIVHFNGRYIEVPFPTLNTEHGYAPQQPRPHPNWSFVSASHARHHGRKTFVYNGFPPDSYRLAGMKNDRLLFLAGIARAGKNLNRAVDLARKFDFPLDIAGGSRWKLLMRSQVRRDGVFFKSLGAATVSMASSAATTSCACWARPRPSSIRLRGKSHSAWRRWRPCCAARRC